MKQLFFNTVLLYTIPLLDDGMDVDGHDDSDGWIAVSHSEDEMSEDNEDDDDEDAQQLKGWFYVSLFILYSRYWA